MYMAYFTYIKRTSNIHVLRRLLNLDKQELPETIKYVAAKLLTNKKIDVYHQNNGKLFPNNTDDFRRYTETQKNISKLIQDKVTHTSAKEWSPSGIITVVYYLAKARAPLNKQTEDIFRKKVNEITELNVIDLWQALWAINALKLTVPLKPFKQYIDHNAKRVFSGARYKNISSVLNALSVLGQTLDTATLLYIGTHYLQRSSGNHNFKDDTNLCNALVSQVVRTRHYIKHTDDRINDPGKNNEVKQSQLVYTTQDVIQSCLNQLNTSDLEGMADLLDATVKFTTWARKDWADQVYRLLEVINRCIKQSIDIPPEDCQGSIQPKVLTVVLRCILETRIYHPELFNNISIVYSNHQHVWSARGNANMLYITAYYGIRNSSAENIAIRLYQCYQTKWFQYVEPTEVLMDACVLAALTHHEVYYHIIARTLECEVSLKHLALALMTLKLAPKGYYCIPFAVLVTIARKLRPLKVNIELQSYTPEYITTLDNENIEQSTYIKLQDICKVNLKCAI